MASKYLVDEKGRAYVNGRPVGRVFITLVRTDGKTEIIPLGDFMRCL